MAVSGSNSWPNSYQLDHARTLAYMQLETDEREVMSVWHEQYSYSVHRAHPRDWHRDLSSLELYYFEIDPMWLNPEWKPANKRDYTTYIGTPPQQVPMIMGQAVSPTVPSFQYHEVRIPSIPRGIEIFALVGVHSNGHWRASSQGYSSSSGSRGAGRSTGTYNSIARALGNAAQGASGGLNSYQTQQNYQNYLAQIQSSASKMQQMMKYYNSILVSSPNFLWEDTRKSFYNSAKNETKFGEIIGYRSWALTHSSTQPLKSVYTSTYWKPREIMLGPDIKVWGVHAWKSIDQARQYAKEEVRQSATGVMVIGSVALWGEAIEHEKGYRATHAKIKSLDDMHIVKEASGEKESALIELRKLYGLSEPK